MNLQVDISFDYIKYPNSHKCLAKNFFSIHPANELPINVDIEFIDYLSFYDILIIPDVIKADKSLELLDVKFRKCFFDDERKLRIFKIYTQKNCELECISHVGKLRI